MSLNKNSGVTKNIWLCINRPLKILECVNCFCYDYDAVDRKTKIVGGLKKNYKFFYSVTLQSHFQFSTFFAFYLTIHVYINDDYDDNSRIK